MRARLVSAIIVLSCCCSVSVNAGFLRGSVFLFPITAGSFTSSGNAQYHNDLSQPDSRANLTGQHSVHGPDLFTAPVSDSDGSYSYNLEGPARAGACYGTTLQVTAVPMFSSNTQQATWTGDTQCAPPAASCDDVNSNGICDYLEAQNIDPNECGDPCSSPIVIKLQPGRYELSGASDPVEFDIDADGTPNRMTWVSRDPSLAFLAMDRNQNSTIDNGSELFGNWTILRTGMRASNGFEALNELDSNGDGMVSVADERWTVLYLWIDLNHDAVSQPGELQRIALSRVDRISTRYHRTGRRDVFGNMFVYQGEAFFDRGRRSIYDVYFLTLP